MNRHRVAGLVATLSVAVAIALGFWNLGGPARQREIGADQQRSDDLRRISIEIDQWYGREKSLPPDLSALTRYNPGLRLKDPLTRVAYEYRPAADTQYQLCATFAFDGEAQRARPYEASMFSTHMAGPQCFHLDAVRTRLYR